MSEEYRLPYFHGALLNEDADKLLTIDGDFLLQSKCASDKVNKILLLAGRLFPNIEKLITYYKKNNLECVGGEQIKLKRAIVKGKFQLNHSDIKIMKKIGCGAYGTVYKGLLLRNLAPVAIKRIDCYDKTEQTLIDMMKEARVMQLYDHINVVRFFGFIVDRAPYLLVMEYCKDGSVENKLRTGGKRISIPARVNIAYQVSCGLEYLHSKMCIHRDIATRNCLLSGNIVKLADFGMCRATVVYKIDLSKPLNVRWLAPEVWRSGETRFCTDIYAFAITLWELFEIPYIHPYSTWKAYKVKEKVMAGYRLPNASDMPDDVATLMRKCWDHDPTRRPSAKEVRIELGKINKKFNGDDDIHTAIFSSSLVFDDSVLSSSQAGYSRDFSTMQLSSFRKSR
uniref:Non-specific protein-tyrosine kinase n=1 Tax=Setaria digitata TaxID=48799 RepID=A0A915Q548_9BILA